MTSYSFDFEPTDRNDEFEPDFHELALPGFDDEPAAVEVGYSEADLSAFIDDMETTSLVLLEAQSTEDLDTMDFEEFDFDTLVESLNILDTNECLARLEVYRTPYARAAARAGRKNPGSEFYNAINRPLFNRRIELRARQDALESIENPTVSDQVDLSRALGELEALTELLVRLNHGITRSYVKRFTSKSSAEDSADFQCAANLGLMVAIDGFDPSRGKFGSWAYKPIQREVLKAVHSADHKNLNPGDFEKRKKVLEAKKQLIAERGEGAPAPTYAEISALSGEVEALVKRVLDAPHLDSIHAPAGDGPSELGDLIPDPMAGFEDKVIASMGIDKLMQYGLSEITEEEKVVLVRVFGLDGEGPDALAEIGADLGKSREAVRQIRSKAISKLMHPIVLKKILLGEKAACR